MIHAHLRRFITFLHGNRILRAGLWYTIGNITIKALGFLMLPIFTRLLTPEEYGTVAIFMAVLGMFFIVLPLYLHVVPIRARFDFDEYYPQFISALTTLTLLSGTGLLLFLALLPDVLHEAIFDLPKGLVLLAASTVVCFTPFLIKMGMWQAALESNIYIRNVLMLNVFVIFVSVTLILLPDYTGLDYERLWGRIAAIVMMRVLFGLRPLLSLLRGGVFVHWPYWRYAVIYAVPLIPHALAEHVLANFDRIMIAQYVGRTESGIYSFAYQIGALVAMVAAALSAAWLPWFYQQMKDEAYDTIRARAHQYLIAFTGLTLVALVGGVLLVPILAPPSYRPAIQIVPVIMASGYFVFLQYLFTGIESHYRKTWYTSLGTLLVAGLNLALNAFFIPRYGYLVAAWTTLISYVCLFLIHAVIVRLVLGGERLINLRLALIGIAAVSVATGVLYMLTDLS